MKPKYLEFCGINSFSEPAEINFEKLLKGGIFGIFGDTGSGKTTILDSIVFALYGRIDRSRGGIGSDIINYNCDRAYVNFEFETESDSGRKLYRIEREMRRKNSAQKAELILIEGEKKTSVGDGKVSAVNALVQEIVGLSFEDFKKCIALPQGEFALFVKSDKKDRLKLIAHLFGLEEYGEQLSARVGDRLRYYEKEVNYREGKLAGYEDITKDAAENLKATLEKLIAESERIEKDFKRAEERFNFIKNAYEKKQQAAETEKQLNELLEKEPQMKEKKIALDKYGFAQAVKAADENASSQRSKIDKEREKAQEFARKAEETAASVNREEDKFLKENYDEKLAELNARLIRAEYLEKDSEELKSISGEIDSLKREYKKYVSEAEKAQREESLLQEEKERLLQKKTEAESCGAPETLLQQKFGGALLRDEYGRSLRFFLDKLDELEKNYPAEGELYHAVEKALRERIGHYQSRFSQTDAAESPDEIFSRFKQLRDLRDRLTKEEHSLELRIKENERQKTQISEKISEIEQKGKKLREDSDKIKSKIDEVSGGDIEYNIFVRNLRKEKSDFEMRKKEHGALIERLKKAEDEARATVLRSEDSVKLFSENLAAYENQLAQALRSGEFADVGAALSLLETYPDLSALEKEIDGFTKEKLSLEAKRAAYAEGIPEVSEEELERASSDYEAYSCQRKNSASDIALNKSRYEDTRKKLETKKEIEKDLKFYRNKYDLLEKLRSLIRGNNFMEYIASEYLSDISAAASETLLKLSCGRYFIRYRQGFFVGDNFNGGELRSVSTLSGGETFLVSLSLALSLSAAIYAKSLKPIEFFFLDEGFGTLDEKLIDTVMDSLEKLKNTHFSIGLISHVEELKHRIDNKITVVGAAEGGSSKIQINY